MEIPRMQQTTRQFTALVLTLLLVWMPSALSSAGGTESTGTIGTFIQGGHSGAWSAPGQSGHGVFAEVIDDDRAASGKRLLIAWFAFFDGRAVWLLASGEVVRDGEGQVARMDAWIYQGNDFPPRYDPALTLEIPWGTILMRFLGCDHAMLYWDSHISNYGSGELDLERLTSISGSSCDPDFGGEDKPDDHGDSWETGTHFATHAVYNDAIEGRLESRGDVDVFIFTLRDGQSVAIFTISSIGTHGVLNRLVGTKETKLAEDDQDGVRSNFLIEELLGPGTFTIHVSGDHVHGTGAYTLWLQTQP
jgi:hypothetical protein